ncbi:class I SAM-dependent methyltransferase [Nocardia carnea]|uniref:class I SAM-dependent methyltransferase n=1 Tax=Nocardia carnea TaxID=37328 RepID=UPI0024585EB7|nr:class I SAM-dependent methyltransferase [Nocardia carnea]
MCILRTQRELSTFYLDAVATGSQTAERLCAPVSDRFARFLNSLHHHVPATALDLGYGMGTYSLALAHAGFRVVAIDQVPARYLQRRLAGHADWTERIRIVERRVEDYAPAEQFGVVVAKDVLHYLRRDQVRRVLGGCIDEAPAGAAHFLEVFTDIRRTDRRGRRVLIEDEAAYSTASFRETIEHLYTGWHVRLQLAPHTERNTDSPGNYFEANRITVCAHLNPGFAVN